MLARMLNVDEVIQEQCAVYSFNFVNNRPLFAFLKKSEMDLVVLRHSHPKNQF